MHKNKKPNQYFIEKIHNKHENLYKYSFNENELLTYRSKIRIQCKIHGEFIQRLDHHINGSKCPRCAGSYYKTTDEVINQLKLIHGDKYDYSKVQYKNSQNKIILICPKHGEFKVNPQRVITKNSKGCMKCHGKEVFNSEDFKIKGHKIHNNYYDYSRVNYINAKIPVKIICPKHGEFEQTPDYHFHSNGCFKCYHTKSKIEQEWLDSLNIKNLKRSFYIKIKNKKFYVDGFDEENNAVYEFNGDFYHGNPKYFDNIDINPVTKINYKILYDKTLEKAKFLKDAGFKVISIWESEYIESKGEKFHIKELTDTEKYIKRVHIKRYFEYLDGFDFDDKAINDYSYILNIP